MRISINDLLETFPLSLIILQALSNFYEGERPSEFK